MNRFVLLFSGLLLAGFSRAEDANARRILDRYEAIRPAEKNLGMYRLDWADSLAVALKRAAKEKRPVCLIVIHAKYGNITSGHC